jgi:predicted enzyme related to lactoylglutathione lyase
MIDRLWYATVFVKDFARALAFYRDTLGLPLRFVDEGHGHASFATEGALFSLQRVEGEQANFAARHTGVGFGCKDLDGEYERLKKLGVVFKQAPVKMSWGGYLSLIEDPDGNVLYLDQLR